MRCETSPLGLFPQRSGGMFFHLCARASPKPRAPPDSVMTLHFVESRHARYSRLLDKTIRVRSNTTCYHIYNSGLVPSMLCTCLGSTGLYWPISTCRDTKFQVELRYNAKKSNRAPLPYCTCDAQARTSIRPRKECMLQDTYTYEDTCTDRKP